MTKTLFICSQNRLRSPTGEHVARLLGCESDSAGLSSSAVMVLDPEQIEWADIIFVMESAHKKKLTKNYSKYLSNKSVIVLGIQDEYDCMQPELIEIFFKKLEHFLELPNELVEQKRLESTKNLKKIKL